MKVRVKVGHFSQGEKRVLVTVTREQRPMSLREIAEKSDMSWVTARKYVKRLVKRKWFVTVKRGKRKYFNFNYERLGI